VGASLALADIGLQESDIDRATEIATANPYWNPREIEADGIHRLLSDAYAGRRPTSREVTDA